MFLDHLIVIIFYEGSVDDFLIFWYNIIYIVPLFDLLI